MEFGKKTNYQKLTMPSRQHILTILLIYCRQCQWSLFVFLSIKILLLLVAIVSPEMGKITESASLF